MTFPIPARAAVLVPFLCLFLLAGPARAFTVGFFLFEPHAMVQDGKPGGAAVEYFRDNIFPEMGLSDLQLVGPVPIARLLLNFRAGEYDAVLLLAKKPSRERRFLYPKQPFGSMASALLVGTGVLSDRVHSPEELRGLVIGYTESAWRAKPMYKPYLRFDMVSATSATALNFRKFNENRIDAIYSPDKYALLYRIGEMKMSRPCKVVPFEGTAEPFYTVFRPGVDKAIVRKYEKALKKVQARLSYESVVEKYLVPINDQNCTSY